MLNCSALPCLLHLLSSAKESIRKEACWTISNITAGNRAQIQVHPDPHSTSATQRAQLVYHVRQGYGCILKQRSELVCSVNLGFIFGFKDDFNTLFFFSLSSSSAGCNRCKHLPSLDRNPTESRIPHQEGGSVGDH